MNNIRVRNSNGENCKIGKQLETVSVDLLGFFKWKEKRNQRDSCLEQRIKNVKGNDKERMELMLYMEYDDPYYREKAGRFIECKNRKWEK